MRSDDVAFVITVAGGGIGPAEQTAWATEGALRRHGVTSAGSLRALADHTYRFLVSAELFAEGTYDPVPVLEELQQPILAIWGAADRIMPAAASARVMQEALVRSGHQHHVLRLMPDASHSVYAIIDGRAGDDFASGYVELMVSWMQQVTAGSPPGPTVDPLAEDEHPTRPSLMNPQGFARWQVQLGFLIAFSLLFGSYFVSGFARRFRRATREPVPGRWIARTVAALGLIIAWGVYVYMGFIAATAAPPAGFYSSFWRWSCCWLRLCLVFPGIKSEMQSAGLNLSGSFCYWWV